MSTVVGKGTSEEVPYVSHEANDDKQEFCDNGTGHPDLPTVSYVDSPLQMDECCSVSLSFKSTGSEGSSDGKSWPLANSWDLAVPSEKSNQFKPYSLGPTEINLDDIEGSICVETSSRKSQDTDKTPLSIQLSASSAWAIQRSRAPSATTKTTATRTTTFESMQILQLRSGSTSEVLGGLLPVRMLTLVICTGCLCAALATSVFDFFAVEAQEMLEGSCNSFPKTYGEFKSRQSIRMASMHATMSFVGTSCGSILFLIPCMIVRRIDGTLSACMVVKLLCILVLANGLYQTIAVFARVPELQSTRTVMYVVGNVAIAIVYPAMALVVLWSLDFVRALTTVRCLFVLGLFNVVGRVAYSEGAAIVTSVSFAAMVLVVAALHAWIVARPLGSPGEVLDLGAQLVLGYANCWLALTIPPSFIPLMRELDLGPMAVVTTWVAVFFLIKKATLTIADNAVSLSWRGASLFPILFLEDFIPVIIFADASSLSVEFFITTVVLLFWEIIRDCPEVKKKLFGYLLWLCSPRCGCASERPRSRISVVARTYFEGIAVILTTCLGGSAASEAVGEVAEEAAEEAAGEGGTILQRGNLAHENVLLVMKIDEARQNMVGELAAAFVILACILTTYAGGYKPLFSAWNVIILLLAELLSVGICTIINTRSLKQVGMGVPAINQSRFVKATMVLAIFNTVTSTFFSYHSAKVKVLIQQGCKK